MSFINDNTPSFHYLTDGDGFPTNIKYNFWKPRYGSDANLPYLGIRTIDQETVDSGRYVNQLSFQYGISDENGGENINYWNNARTGGLRRGAMNYIPLLPEEAIKVYWLFRGVKMSLSPSFISAGAKGSTATVIAPSNFDAGILFNRSGYRPYDRLWNSGIVGTGVPYKASDNASRVWRTDTEFGRIIRENRAGGSASYDGFTYLPVNQLIRFPKRGAESDFGFELLFRFTANRSAFIESGGSWIQQREKGSAQSAISVYLSSAIYWPEFYSANNTTGEYETRFEDVDLSVINIEGVPLLVATKYNGISYGTLQNSIPRFSANIFDLIFEKVT